MHGTVSHDGRWLLTAEYIEDNGAVIANRFTINDLHNGSAQELFEHPSSQRSVASWSTHTSELVTISRGSQVGPNNPAMMRRFRFADDGSIDRREVVMDAQALEQVKDLPVVAWAHHPGERPPVSLPVEIAFLVGPIVSDLILYDFTSGNRLSTSGPFSYPFPLALDSRSGSWACFIDDQHRLLRVDCAQNSIAAVLIRSRSMGHDGAHGPLPFGHG